MSFVKKCDLFICLKIKSHAKRHLTEDLNALCIQLELFLATPLKRTIYFSLLAVCHDVQTKALCIFIG